MNDIPTKLFESLWRIYNRLDKPSPWDEGGNLPWDDPDFSLRMLREHLDESHGAASRITTEREKQIEWIWNKLELRPGCKLLDVTCGPGLYATEFARRGCQVTGIDFSPASISYARDLAMKLQVADLCDFIQQDVRQASLKQSTFDAALFIYGQLAVFTKEEAQDLLTTIAYTLKSGGKLCLELLDPDRIDKKNSSWWFTDDKGLWGNEPFLHLGERFWNEDAAVSIERFHILRLETGQMDEITLCDQAYTTGQMEQMIKKAGFNTVAIYPAWDQLSLYDAEEWIVYLAKK